MLLLAMAQVPAQAQDRPVLRAATLREALTIDGRLDEPVWATADSTDALTQVEPREGAPPTGRTVVRVLANADAVVIGIRADDPDPSAMIAYTRRRDGSLGSEDHVRLVLDTFQDGRSGYVFAVGPYGARYDALITRQGEDENSDWDAVWDAAAIRTPTGWSVEIRIPVKSLIFRPGLTAWGFNIQRRIHRLLETSRWSGARRDWELNQTSRAGLLTGLPAFRLGVGLTVQPAVTAGGRHPAPHADLEGVFHPSLDLTQRIGTNLLGSVTVNTDFAETEVDERRTNLTRFPIRFPEKREFFLAGSDIFDFGLSAADAVIPFFSRRIGLLAGWEVPLRAGLKLSGRAGQTNVGALITRTGSDDSLGIGGETLGAVRVRHNVLAESSVGAIATFGDPSNAGGAWTAGADVTFQTSRLGGDKNFLVGAWALATDRDGLTGRRGSAGFKIDYPNDDWDALLLYRWIGDGFQPSLGFVPRPGVQMWLAGASRRFRPEAGALNSFSFAAYPEVITDLDGRWESWSVEIQPLDLLFRSGDEIAIEVEPQGERLLEPFEVSDGVEIPAGEYGFVRVRVEVETASKRAVQGEVGWTFGRFYDGTLHELEASLAWRPASMVQVAFEAERNHGTHPAGSFTTDLVAGRVQVGFSPDLELVSFVQYDTESRNLGTNTRLRWTFHPMGDLFVVYNHNVDRPLDRWAFNSNELLVKAKVGFRY